MKKYLYIMLAYVSATQYAFAWLQEDITPPTAGVIGNSASSGWSYLDAILFFARDTIFNLMAVIAIGMFLFVGWKLIVARWNPEEFKKALQSFIYIVVGIFVVSFAWAAVKLIAGLDI